MPHLPSRAIWRREQVGPDNGVGEGTPRAADCAQTGGKLWEWRHVPLGACRRAMENVPPCPNETPAGLQSNHQLKGLF